MLPEQNVNNEEEANFRLRHLNVRIRKWHSFPSELDLNIFYVSRQSFQEIQGKDSRKSSPDVEFLALRIEELSVGSSKFPIVAISPCDFLPMNSDPDAGLTPADDGVTEIYGETWNFSSESQVFSAVIVQPINLKRVLVAVRSSETRIQLEKILSQRKLLPDVHLRRLIIRQGSSFCKANSDAVVLKCEPVQQGLLAIGTEIVVAELTHRSRGRRSSGSSIHHPTSLSMPGIAGGQNKVFKNFDLYERAVKFASTFSESSKNLPIGKFAVSVSQDLLRAVAENLKLANQFSVSVLLQPLVWKSAGRRDPLTTNSFQERSKINLEIDENQHFPQNLSGILSQIQNNPDALPSLNGPKTAHVEDGDSNIFVSQKTFERIGKNEQMWFWASSPDGRLIKRMVRLASLAWTLDGDAEAEAFVNPLLWFNLNQHPSPLVQKAVSIELSPVKESPEYFHTIRISLIRSPGVAEDDVEQWYPLLEEKFLQAKMVGREDVLVLQTPCTRKSIYLKVVDAEPSQLSCGLVAKNKTFLFLCGVTNSFVPLAMDRFLRQPSPRAHSDWPFSTLFDNHVTKLISIFAAYSADLHSDKIPPVLLYGDRACGKQVVIHNLALHLNMQIYQINVLKHIVADTAAAMESRLHNQIEKAALFAPCIIVFRHLDFLVEEKEEPRVWKALDVAIKAVSEALKKYPVLVFGTCSCKPSAPLEDIFPIHFHVPRINAKDRLQLLREFIDKMNDRVECKVDAEAVASDATGFSLSDMTALFENTQLEAVHRIKTGSFPGQGVLDFLSEETIRLSGVAVEQCDFMAALHNMSKAQSAKYGSSIDTSVTWEDIGGLEAAKHEILRTIQLPLVCSQIQDSGLQRLGVLLCGPPGNGKTLLVKAVAAQCSLNFISVKGPELINMYVGQSEENVRAVFERARMASPCIIFFDEIDSLAPNRGRSGDSGGVVDRVVSQLMTEMDGLARNNGIFVFGATNRPDLIDSALLRPGRFDKIIQIGNPATSEARLNVLRAVLRKCSVSTACDLSKVEKNLPLDISGADLYAVCASAQLRAISRLITEGKVNEVPVIEPGDFAEDCSS